MIRSFIGALLALHGLLAAPAFAATLKVEAGQGAQEKLQEALILAQPGDVAEPGAAASRLPTNSASMRTASP